MSRYALSADRLDEFLVVVDMTIERPECRARADLTAEDVRLDPPRQDAADLVAHKPARGDCEDVVELFQSPLLGLWEEQEDHDERHNVQAGVEAKGADWMHGAEHAWEGDGKDRGPEQARSHSPGHADFAMRQWEHFCRVCERHRTFTR